MLSFKEFQQIKDEPIVAFYEAYANNNYYVYFSDNSTVKINPNPSYTTPPGIYAWQMNSYKKPLAEWLANEMSWYISKESDRTTKDVGINSVFPYASNRDYMHMLKAKSGLKWLNLRRMSSKETYDLFDVIKEEMGLEWNVTADDVANVFIKTREKYNTDKEVDTPDLVKAFYGSPGTYRELFMRGHTETHVADEDILKLFKRPAHNETTRMIEHMKAFMNQRDTRERIGNRTGKDLTSAMTWLLLTRFVGPNKISEMLKKAGYDAVRDDTRPRHWSTTGANMKASGIIWATEPGQVFFLHEGAFTVDATIDSRRFKVKRKNAPVLLKYFEQKAK